MRASFYPQAAVWIKGAEMLSCAAPGDLVAYSEMGWASYARADLRFLDLRGLVDRDIAHAAPDAIKMPVGVVDRNWWLPTSPTGRIILKDRPVLVEVLGTTLKPTVLDGQYVALQTATVEGTQISVWRRADVRCPRSAG
jgi:hypothetical protein